MVVRGIGVGPSGSLPEGKWGGKEGPQLGDLPLPLPAN